VKFAINLALSLATLAICVWLVWPAPDERERIARVFLDLDLAALAPYLACYVLFSAIMHFCRAWRWNHLLAPIGVRIAPGPLLAISSVGFMAILALPARLGEFVRPALIRKRGQVSGIEALGTVAVERVVDGLLVSLLVFCAFFSLRGPEAPGWMMPTAYAALGIFSAALVFLVLSLWRTEQTVRVALAFTLLPRLAPRLAVALSDKLFHMIRGFQVLLDGKHLLIFVAWSAVYWTFNALSFWVLALGFSLKLSLTGAFATMGLVAVGITLPNAPALVGQFHKFALLGLSLYLAPDVVLTRGLAFAIALHLAQVGWYILAGAVALATPYVSFAEVVAAGKLPDDAGDERKAS
jgi:uncharacterized membrane protein YbhN (UPF0104 family)